MADKSVETLQLQVDASVELARRNLESMIKSVEQLQRTAGTGLAKVDQGFESLGKRINNVGSIFTSFVGGALGGIGISAFTSAGRAVLQFADDLDASADQANIAVGRYQTLKEGLRVLEVGGEQADKIFKALNDTLGAVQSGTAAKGVTDALDRMGITAKIANGQISSTDELLDAIAASAKNFNSAAEFTSSVVDIVGRKVGVDLAAALRDGGKALKENEQAFRDAGGVIEEEYIKRLADANEAIDSFASHSKSKLAIWAAGAISDFDDVGKALDAFRAKNGRNPDPIEFIDTVSGSLAKSEKARGDKAKATASKARDQADINALPQGSAIRQSMQDAYDAKYGAPEIVVTAPRKTFPGATPPPKKTGAKAAKAAKVDPSPAQLRIDSYSDGVDSVAVADRLLAQPLADLDAMGTKLTDIKQTIVTLPPVDILTDAEQEQLDRFGQNLSDNLAQALVYGQNLGDALVNSLKAAAAEALSSGLFDLLLGKDKSGGILGSVAGAVFGGFRAGGGPVAGGVPYIVGEKGPELFVPNGNGSIARNGSYGGGQVSVSVDVAPSPLFVTSVRTHATQAGAAAAGGVIAKAVRRPIPRGRGV